MIKQLFDLMTQRQEIILKQPPPGYFEPILDNIKCWNLVYQIKPANLTNLTQMI